MTPNQHAILIYGVLTLLLTAYLAAYSGSRLALAMVVGAAGATYLFQVAQEYEDTQGWILLVLWFLALVLPVLAVLTALLGV